MLRVALRFPAGRYHATPWGRHVNEGAVEWPPSPWRVCRALIAVGFNKLGWTEVPPAGRSLLERLSSELPVYYLPTATTGHTRHYMPVYKGSPDKVLDTFAWVGRGEEALLGIEWPLSLEASEQALLAELLRGLQYLGRAESWVEGQLASDDDRTFTGEPTTPAEAPPGVHYERVPLLAPMHAPAYAAWRRERLGEALRIELEADQEAKRAKGKKVPRSLGKARRERVERRFPTDLVEALRASTADLQREGWSQPPGSRWTGYWRRADALTARVHRAAPPRRPKIWPAAALLALEPDTQRARALPPLTQSLWRGELLHKALIRAATRSGEPPPVSLSGRTEAGPLEGHRHASLLPLDLDADGRLDHVLVDAPQGLEPAAVAALRAVRKTYAKDLPRIFLSLVGLGAVDDLRVLGDKPVPQLGRSRVWVSFTPFVPPRYLKRRGKDSLEGQVQAELERRAHARFPGLSDVEIEVEGLASGPCYEEAAAFWDLFRRRSRTLVGVSGRGSREVAVQEGSQAPAPARLASRWRHFKLVRRDEGKAPPTAVGIGLRLTFAEELRGPLSLGYGSHLGLGLFVPVAHPDGRMA